MVVAGGAAFIFSLEDLMEWAWPLQFTVEEPFNGQTFRFCGQLCWPYFLSSRGERKSLLCTLALHMLVVEMVYRKLELRLLFSWFAPAA